MIAQAASGPELDLDLVVDPGVEPALSAERTERICRLVLEQEGVNRPCEVSVSYVGDERIRALNARWRGIDRATDVISLECERPDSPELAPGELCCLGDIVLAPAYLARQAASFGTSPAAETALMAIHGMLHLLGYDHLDDAEARVMEAREDELLALAGHQVPEGGIAVTRHSPEEDS